jgi:tetratricopeptide (TPR) repeat protein
MHCRLAAVLCAAVAAIGAGPLGCSQSSPAKAEMAKAEYGDARVQMNKGLVSDKGSRMYILSRMNLVIATLADGQAESAEKPTKEMWDLLRTQGVNADKTVAAVVLTENVKVWKGEPFEQALAYTYAAINYAQRGEWDNARTAAEESLFLLQDFGQNEKGEKKSTLEIAQSAAKDDKYLDSGYQPIETNYTLGYLMTGVCSHILGRDEEGRANFDKAVKFNPNLQSLTQQLLSQDYNTLLVVDAGPGPEKISYGPDNALACFKARQPNTETPIAVSVNGSAPLSFPEAVDVNAMSVEHFWNNMEDVRIAKSHIGDALLAGAAGVGAAGIINNSSGADYAAIGMAIVGLIAKASAAADTTHAEFMPQRVYLVPINITAADSTVTLDVSDNALWHMVLPAMAPPKKGDVALCYVRPPTELPAPASWQTSGQIAYANDWYGGKVEGDTLPYILGGMCVRKPSESVLKHYQEAGNLTDMSLTDLENLYQEEGIKFTIQEQDMFADNHVLEGGKSMVAPRPGTAGYLRVFCQRHSAYAATSKLVQEMQEKYKDKAASLASSGK